ncbi:hypothetical protein VO57_015200 [Citromicrobium bathyomarinum]|uniref:hypothetical protein n=1 Tax=unclassified Citromicrobium TaxID=2630544 RepID=UPI000B01EF91|nr:MULTISPECIES: hypothetical protein [unclassified Citromicrobium]|tara:strand:+ start:13111 stop:13263 length:153 start_codon:yes stop_codon:yes gene_type:complete
MERDPDRLFVESLDHEPEFEDEWDDCGLMPDGQCSMAGTEWCDWDCGRLG